MHYLVTGGCGFIGSYLADSLLGEGHQVTIIDNLTNGKHENAPKGACVLVEDVTAEGVLDALVHKVDGIFHLAAVVSVRKSTTDWMKSHQVNVGGLVAIFDALIRHKRYIPVVYASSAAVYGTSHNIPYQETENCKPLSPYGVDKIGCEGHAAVASNIYQIPTIGLRIFNVYGSRQDPFSPYAGVVSVFFNHMMKNLPITIFGDGEQIRDFIYVGDVVTGFRASMYRLESREVIHDILNLCTGKQTSLNTLTSIIASITHSYSKILYTESRADDIRISIGDPTRCQEIIGFSAQSNLYDILSNDFFC